MKPETRGLTADRVYVATAPKVDRLAERINNLSCPRDYQTERVPDGLVDSLPPEGRCRMLYEGKSSVEK